MDRSNNFSKPKDCTRAKSNKHAGSCSSNYSTCSSNDFISNNNFNSSKQATEYPTVLENTIDEANYTVNILDQNLDVIKDDVFMDCNDTILDEGMFIGPNESTEYKNLPESTSIISDKSNEILPETLIHNERDFLLTIFEETEVCSRHSTSIRASTSVLKDDSKVASSNLKRVLFNNEVISKEEKIARLDHSKKEDRLVSKNGKNKLSDWKENRDKNCNYQNTTESFVQWEKACEKLNNLTCRHSASFSTVGSYDGDNECTKSFKTLDDTYLCESKLFVPDKPKISKSKSCESLLEDVKHLPHVFYQKYDHFLKCLSKEIEDIRKQNVKCTCQHTTCRKNLRDALSSNSSNTTVKSPAVKRLSPNVNNKSQNYLTLSPRSPNVEKTTPKKKYSSWRREIVSPVAEYIRGNRPSPCKSSPVKKRI